MLILNDSLPMILYRALDRILPAYRELFSRFDLTEQQWRLLRVVWASKNVTSASLSETTLLSPPSLVSIIDRLEKKGLVTRVRSVEDRRQIYIVATAKGRALQQEIMPLVDHIHENLKNSITDDEWQALVHLLEKVSDTGVETPQTTASTA